MRQNFSKVHKLNIVPLLCLSLFLTYNHVRYSWQYSCQKEGGILLRCYQTFYISIGNRFLGYRLTTLPSAITFPRRHARWHRFFAKQFHTTLSLEDLSSTLNTFSATSSMAERRIKWLIALEDLGDAWVSALLRSFTKMCFTSQWW